MLSEFELLGFLLYMISFLKQGMGLKVSAAKLYPNFHLECTPRERSVMFFLRLY